MYWLLGRCVNASSYRLVDIYIYSSAQCCTMTPREWESYRPTAVPKQKTLWWSRRQLECCLKPFTSIPFIAIALNIGWYTNSTENEITTLSPLARSHWHSRMCRHQWYVMPIISVLGAYNYTYIKSYNLLRTLLSYSTITEHKKKKGNLESNQTWEI